MACRALERGVLVDGQFDIERRHGFFQVDSLARAHQRGYDDGVVVPRPRRRDLRPADTARPGDFAIASMMARSLDSWVQPSV